MATKYTTVQGDTWDLISYKAYGSEMHIDLLMQANFEQLDYTIFPAGVKINIPALPEDETDESPEWRKIEDE